jgi:hypothetical protein
LTRRAGDLFDPRAVLALLAALTLARLAVNAWLDPLPLSGDEAQYWLYGEHLAGGYYSKPPLLPWLMRLSTDLLGDAHWAMRLPSVVLHLAIALVVFVLARTLFDRATGTVAALLYLTLPAVSVSSMLASTDPAMMLGWALASLALVHALATGALAWWALAGAALGYGLLGKYTAVAWLAGAGLLLALDPYWRRGASGRGIAVALAAALVVLAPNLAWNAANGFPTIAHVGENADLAGTPPPLGERLAELGDFLLAQAGVFGPIPFAILLWLLVRPATWRNPALRFVLVLGLPLLAAIAAQAFLNRANANWAAPVYLGFTVAVAAWLVAGARRRLTLATIGLHLVVFALVVTAAALHRTPSPYASALDPFRKLRGVDAVAAAVAPILEAHPDARLVMTERMLMANVLEATDWPLERTVMWNADGEIDDHFELVTAFPPDGRGTYVVVTRGDAPAALLDHFTRHKPLTVAHLPTHADRGFVLRIHLARDFRGYGD